MFTLGVAYSLSYGDPFTIMIQFFIAWGIDQAKSIPVQFCVYWVIIRRFGLYANVDLTVWDDE